MVNIRLVGIRCSWIKLSKSWDRFPKRKSKRIIMMDFGPWFQGGIHSWLDRWRRRGHTSGFSKNQSVGSVHSQDQFEQLLTSISSILIGVDEKGVVRRWNKAAEATFNLKLEDVLGKPLSDCPVDWPWETIRAGLIECQKENAVVRLDDVPFTRADGSPGWLGLTLPAMIENDEGQAGFLIFGRDITGRKKAEENERERKSLQEAVRSMEQVLGVVAHELRTPLAALRVTLEFLLTQEAKKLAEYDTFLNNIHDEVIRLAELVNNLLEAARLNSGNASWNWSPVRLAEACDDALKVVRPLINQERVRLDFKVEPEDLEMKGDAEGIRRLLINLVSNAAKHTKEGYIKVDVSKFSLGQERWIKIRVQDTGEGISEEVVGKLGQAFVLNAGVVGANYIKGAGLGLSICKAIAAAHGGKITVASTIERETTFTVLMRGDLTEPVREPVETGICQEIA